MKTQLSLKKNYLILMIFTMLLLSMQTKAQCPTGDLPIYTMQDIIDFQTNYPNCTTISGNLSISGNTITSLAGLSQITSVDGTLNINNNDILPNLNGLDNITTIGGDLIFNRNNGLTNATGLEGLQSIGSVFYIHQNANLTNLNGLSSLTTIGGDFTGISIFDNDAMTSLDGIETLTSVKGISIYGNELIQNLDALANVNATSITYLEIINNPALSTCNNAAVCTFLANAASLDYISNNASGCNYRWEVESACGQSCPTSDDWYFDTQESINDFATLFPTCTTVPGYLTIQGSTNTEIISLAGLSQITSVDGNLNIRYNDALSSLNGLDNITTIGRELYIYQNIGLTNLSGLNNLQSTGASVNINSNANLVNLNGLSSLTTIGGDFTGISIFDNDAMTSLDGIENLTTVKSISITENALIQNLDALANVNASSLEYLLITNNPALSTCDNAAVCTYLADTASSAYISNNASGCNSRAEVETACINDTDGDGIADAVDNCPNTANADQADMDNDGIGDACDDDADGDGFDNTVDCDDLDDTVGLPTTWYADTDNDGYGDANSSVEDCTQPAGYVNNADDCDDTDATIYPGAVEIANDGIDQDCDGEDLIEVVDPCPAPSDILFTSTTTTISGSLTENGTATMYDLATATINNHYQVDFEHPVFQNIPMPFTHSGMSPGQTYVVWVRADCSGDDTVVSDWVGPFNPETQASTVRAVPNPTTGLVKFEGATIQSIQVFDAYGKLVLQQAIKENQASLHGLNTGTYMIHAMDKNHIWHLLQIIKK